MRKAVGGWRLVRGLFDPLRGELYTVSRGFHHLPIRYYRQGEAPPRSCRISALLPNRIFCFSQVLVLCRCDREWRRWSNRAWSRSRHGLIPIGNPQPGVSVCLVYGVAVRSSHQEIAVSFCATLGRTATSLRSPWGDWHAVVGLIPLPLPYPAESLRSSRCA